MDLGRQHRLPPDLISGARDIGQGYHSARGGSTSSEHPVHARVTWRDAAGVETTEMVWGLTTAWTSLAMHVVWWRHGEWHSWLRRQDVQPCRCTVIHSPGWWPVNDAGGTGADLCTMTS